MPFGSLWLPVIVSAVVVFVASSVMHMALKYHKADYKGLPNEVAVLDVLGKGNLVPGVYFLPYCPDHGHMKDPAMKAKFEKGPIGLLTILPKGGPAMGKLLGLWFAFSLFVSFTAAYVARHTLQPGADGLLVMRITGTVAFAAYGISHLSDSIWKGQPWSNTMRSLLDAAIYAVLTGLVFRTLWPTA
ncbi:MAG TPA: hypothetical protein VGR67_05575 [Candidatus Polarisedimenticolia bacterium]|jgi:hypothetical protein|nr:hypothetical protein [Candidatus Polarisedimenticolia bacterium]